MAAGAAVAAASGGGSSGSSSSSASDETGIQTGPGTTYVNDGTVNITASESHPYAVGVAAVGSGSAVNNGTISYGSESVSGVSSLSSVGVSSSFSQDDANVTGMYAVYGSTVNNYGSINLYSGSSTGMNMSYGTVINNASSTITSYSYSDDASGIEGDHGIIENSGNITVESCDADSDATGISGESVYIKNEGNIDVYSSGKGYGISVEGNSDVVNTGTITVRASGDAYGIYAEGNNNTVYNTGSINVTSSGGRARGIFFYDGGGNRLYNSGSITVNGGDPYSENFLSGDYIGGNVEPSPIDSEEINNILPETYASLISTIAYNNENITVSTNISRGDLSSYEDEVDIAVSVGAGATVTNNVFISNTSGNDLAGMYAALGGISENIGEISLAGDNVAGMLSVYYSSSVNSGTINVTGDYTYGISAEKGSWAENSGSIISSATETSFGLSGENSTLTNKAGGSIASYSRWDAYGIYANKSVINNSGNVYSESFGSDSDVYGVYAVSASTISNSDSGVIVSSGGIINYGLYAGSSVINNSGTINSFGGRGTIGVKADDSSINNSGVVISSGSSSTILAEAFEINNSTLTNSGRIGAFADSSMNPTTISGNNVVINNVADGVIVSSNTGTGGAIGISVTENSVVNSSGTVNVFASAGSATGILAGYDSGTDLADTVVNDGTINVNADDGNVVGISAEGSATSKAYVSNNGTINVTSVDGDAYGIYAVNAVNVRNTGTINAVSTNGNAYGIYFTGSGGTLYNSGTINVSAGGNSAEISGDYDAECAEGQIYVNGECKTMSDMGTEYQTEDNTGVYYFGYKQDEATFTLSEATSNRADKVGYSASNTGENFQALLSAFGLSVSTVTNTIEIDAESPDVNESGSAVMFSSAGASAVNIGTISVTGSDGFYRGMRTYGGYLINSGTVTVSGSLTASAAEGAGDNFIGMKVKGGGFAVNSGLVNVALNSSYSTNGASIEGMNSSGGYLVNQGSVTVSANIYAAAGDVGDDNGFYIIGMEASLDDDEIYTSGLSNYGNITVNSSFSSGSTGITAGLAGSNVLNNYGTINVTADSGMAAGIAVIDSGDTTIVNDGDINVTNTNGDAYGVYVTAGATVSLYNTGTISVTATNGTAYGIYLEDGDSSGEKTSLSLYNSGTFTLTDDGVTINADGTGSDIAASTNNYVVPEGNNTSVSGLDSNPYASSSGSGFSSALSSSLSGLDLDSIGAAVYVMQGGSYTSDQSVYGSLGVAASVTQGSNDDSYTVEGAVKAGEDIDVDVYSESVMFDASLDVTSDSSGEYNEIGNASLTRRSFSSLTNNSSLASFLEKNYEAGNIVSSFDELKSADTLEGFTESLGNITDSVILPNFTRQNFNTAKRINRTFHDEMFNGEKNTVGFVSGYDSRNARSGIEGYSDSFYDVYAMFDKGNPGVFGLSVAKLSSSYDDDSERDVTYFFLHKPFMFELGETSLLLTPTAGYSNGDYTRKEDGVSSSADISAWHYGITNEARYKAELGFADLEPSAELNLQGYYQNRLEEGNGAEVKAQNFLNAEGGLGLYLSRVFSLGSNQGLNIRGGGTYYYATNNHRQKATISGAEGYYKMESSDTDNGSGVINLTAEYRINDIRLHGELYERLGRDSIFNWNAGISYMF